MCVCGRSQLFSSAHHADWFNGAAATGNDLVTQNVGLKLKPKRNTEIGLAYEFPHSDSKDIKEARVQVDLIFRY